LGVKRSRGVEQASPPIFDRARNLLERCDA
jgi:hypothetical protein